MERSAGKYGAAGSGFVAGPVSSPRANGPIDLLFKGDGRIVNQTGVSSRK
jgi:hypothetical protein